LLNSVGVYCWLFGGWGLDARLGRIARQHSDIGFWVERFDGERAEEVLTAGGYAFLDTQPVEESREFTKSGIICSFTLFDRASDGTYRTQGRCSDWLFPPGCFPDIRCRLGDLLVAAMSAEGTLAMKEHFSQPRNGKPLRGEAVTRRDRRGPHVVPGRGAAQARRHHPSGHRPGHRGKPVYRPHVESRTTCSAPPPLGRIGQAGGRRGPREPSGRAMIAGQLRVLAPSEASESSLRVAVSPRSLTKKTGQ
jgi:lincosamide nucleotidyltransferase A/C/D/E